MINHYRITQTKQSWWGHFDEQSVYSLVSMQNSKKSFITLTSFAKVEMTIDMMEWSNWTQKAVGARSAGQFDILSTIFNSQECCGCSHKY